MALPDHIGKYEIVEQIGAGGFGVIYKARDPFLERWVALKTCSATGEEASQRFVREARLAASLQHPNITLIFDFGIENGVPYFVQEFLSGIDLDELLRRGRVSLRGALAILLQVSAGLDCAHSQGIVHRDIKPANIRLLSDGTVKIMDFGIAKSVQADVGLTQTGVALGTAGYLAPEQIAGAAVDARTDLFSLGAIAYELVTGVRPFSGASLSNVLYKVAHESPVPPRHLNPRCPERLEKAILKALSKEPADRFATVREFAWRLEESQVALGDDAGSRLESTIAMVRGELEEILSRPDRDAAQPHDLEDTPLAHLPDEHVPRAPRHLPLGWLALLLGLVAAGAVLVAGLHGYLRGHEQTVAVAPAAAPTPLPTAVPTPVPTPLPVTVGLFVDPPSVVHVDGRSLGKIASTTVTLTVGEHVIVQRVPGYAESTKTFTVTPRTTRIALRLPPFGYVSVINDLGVPLRGSRVYVDGTNLGSLPVEDAKIAAGRHHLRVVWPGGREHRETIDVPEAGRLHRTVRPD